MRVLSSYVERVFETAILLLMVVELKVRVEPAGSLTVMVSVWVIVSVRTIENFMV